MKYMDYLPESGLNDNQYTDDVKLNREFPKAIFKFDKIEKEII